MKISIFLLLTLKDQRHKEKNAVHFPTQYIGCKNKDFKTSGLWGKICKKNYKNKLQNKKQINETSILVGRG